MKAGRVFKVLDKAQPGKGITKSNLVCLYLTLIRRVLKKCQLKIIVKAISTIFFNTFIINMLENTYFLFVELVNITVPFVVAYK